jgi:prolyl 4-hydroxylase
MGGVVSLFKRPEATNGKPPTKTSTKTRTDQNQQAAEGAAHQAHSDCRFLGGIAQEGLKRGQGGKPEAVALKTKIKGLVQNDNSMNEDQSQAGPTMAAHTGLAAGKGVTSAARADGRDPHDLSSLAQLHPSFPLSEYVNEGNFWHINKEYPGLQCISKDPFIFLVQNLLTTEQCSNLIIKGGNCFVKSRTSGPTGASVSVRDNRTSSDVRVPFDEVPTVQGIFSKVLNAPVSQFEPLKLIRYEDGQYFKPHHDAGGAQHLAPRRITLFVYLNTCDAGGETQFTRCGIKIKPRAGLGVIHFPSRLSTAKELPLTGYKKGAKVRFSKPGRHGTASTGRHGTVKSATGKKKKFVTVGIDGEEEKYELFFEGTDKELQQQIPLVSSLRGVRDERLKHEGMPVAGEKFLASQWVFEGTVETNALLENYSVNPLGGAIL